MRSRGTYVKRRRLPQLIRRVDHAGVINRRTTTLIRRQYECPCPNYVWHIDGLHKLIRWKFVIHGGIDGFSRLITFLECSDNNRADTVHTKFKSAVQQYGRPIRIRSDHGGENVLVWRDMINETCETSSVIVGSSVHNERVERMWRDINRLVCDQLRDEFYALENNNLFDVDNEVDIFCLQAAYINYINMALSQYQLAHNNHSIRTAGNYTPLQLHNANLHLFYLYSSSCCQSSSGETTISDLSSSRGLSDLPYVTVVSSNIVSLLPNDVVTSLQEIVANCNMTGLHVVRQCYMDVVDCVGSYLQSLNNH